jgi:hypothetical protein
MAVLAMVVVPVRSAPHAPATEKPSVPGVTKVTPAQIAEGKRLYDQLACANCHSVENKGGCLAPPLDCVSVRRTDQYLMMRLGQGEEDKFIKKIGHPELMPHPRFPKEQLRAVIAYLRTLPCKIAPKGK